MRQREKTLITICSILSLFLIPSTLYGYKEVVARAEYNDGIIWDNKKYIANIEFIKTDPSTPENEADSMRVFFIRTLTSSDNINGEKKFYEYEQSWSTIIKSLEEVEEIGTRKIYIDGVYQKDTVIKKYEYHIVGDLECHNYSHRLKDGTPLTGREYEKISTNSYIPVSVEFFQWLHQTNPEWKINKSQRKEFTFGLFDEIYLSGPDSIYTFNLDKDNLATIRVQSDRMEIYVTQGDKWLSQWNFQKKNKPQFIVIYDDDTKSNKTILYPFKDERPWEIVFFDDKIIFSTQNKKTEYKTDTRALKRALKLAKVRGIIREYDSFDYFQDFWFY